MLLTSSIFFYHFLQVVMGYSCFIHIPSFLIFVMSVCSGAFMEGIVQIVVLSVIVCVCVWTPTFRKHLMLTST